MVFAPGEGRGGFRAGDCEDLMAPQWVVATCNSFWSGERSLLLSVGKTQKQISGKGLQDIILNQDQPFGQLTLTG